MRWGLDGGVQLRMMRASVAKNMLVNSSSEYVRGLVDELSRLRPLALSKSRAEDIHRLRVTTRRLGAVLDLSSGLRVRQREQIKKGLKKIRRRLGRLRDIDVMLGQLREQKSHAAVRGWLARGLQEERGEARRKLRRKGLKTLVEGHLGKITAVWQAHCAAPSFQEFCRSADAVEMGGAQTDVHAVRIAGKRFRYRLELARAFGLIGEDTQKRLKRVQDLLGQWHDRVVLADYCLGRAVKDSLSLCNPALLREVLEFVRELSQSAAGGIEAFVQMWRSERNEICAVMGKLGSAKEQMDATLPGQARKGPKRRNRPAAAADGGG